MKLLRSPFKSLFLAMGIAALGSLSSSPAAHAQTPGSIDPTFNIGAGTDGEVRGLARQTDGKVIVGGIFNDFNAVPRSCILRLNVDGSVDTSFDPGTGIAGGAPNTGVYAVAIQADGKVIVGGVYDSINGVAHSGIARLNPDGSLDTTFTDAGLTEGSDTFQIAVQADGKIVYCGNFGSDFSPLQRVNANGSDDTGFNPAQGNGEVESLAVQADGRIVIGGSFEYLQGANDTDVSFRQGIARLLPNGSIDQTFAGNLGLDFQDFFETRTVAIQADEKVVFGGTGFESSGPQSYGRANADGTLDTTYAYGDAISVGPVYAIVIQPDNNAILGSADRVIGGPLSAVPPPPPSSSLPTVSIVAKATKLAENGPKDKIIVTRTGDLSGDLTVNYSAKGSAQAGVNYKKLTGSVVIPAGSVSAAIKLKPVNDEVHDGTFVLKLTLLPSGSYTLGAPGKAKIKILNAN